MDLSNGLEWLKIYDQVHVARPNLSKPGKYLPIPYILIPSYLDNYIVAISSETSFTKPTWKVGGRVYTFIEVNNSDINQLRSNRYYTIPHKIVTELKISRISTYYRLIVDVPKWFVDVYLQAWVYLGTETPDNLEEKVNQIQTDLIRIESKIDTNALNDT